MIGSRLRASSTRPKWLHVERTLCRGVDVGVDAGVFRAGDTGNDVSDDAAGLDAGDTGNDGGDDTGMCDLVTLAMTSVMTPA